MATIVVTVATIASRILELWNFKITKEFTENWLQALSLSAAFPEARRIKPLMNDIDSICMERSEPEQLDAANRLWEYAGTVGMRPLLTITPYQQNKWRFDDEEAFVFERSESKHTESLDKWILSLGLRQHKVSMLATINQDDWSEILRNEAIRLGRPLKVIGSPPAKESLLWLNCIAEWNRSDWTFQFDDPSWVSKKFEGGFAVARPASIDIEKSISESVEFAIKNLTKRPTTATTSTSITSNVKLDEQPWISSIPSLIPLHKNIFTNQSASSAVWFCRTWTCVWPVVYREQNRLRGPCDIDAIRGDLKLCFQNVPQLVLWTFALGKLICQHQLRRGLGICGEFK